jgi:uncharacterized protein YxjI
MNLIDPSINHYVLHEKSCRLGDSEIFSLHDERIGIVKRKRVLAKEEIRLLNSDESTLCIIKKKQIGTHTIYDVETLGGEVIGRCKKPMLKKSVDMYDAEENMIFKTLGRVSNWNFQIIHPENNKEVFAEITKESKLQDVSTSGVKFNNRYGIHVIDPDTPRLLLLAFAIIISDVYHGE